MQETIRSQGLRAIHQQLCRGEADVRAFYSTLPGSEPRCVVKPNMSAGSDSVFLCHSLDDTLRAFRAIDGAHNGLGNVNEGALCQEYLSGTEYVIDGVSRDGVYKVIAIWVCVYCVCFLIYI